VEYKLFAVRVFVTNWERAIRFYSETLGMAIAYQSDEHHARTDRPRAADRSR
jgi:catechol 2,3-dioxygenase-like lactoylglutathione lyase family enzyme